MSLLSATRHNTLFVFLSVAFVLGITVALVLIFLWRSNPALMSEGGAYHAALVVCPPFLLVRAVNGISDSPLALVLATGSIVFANGPLYAGGAAFGIWAFKAIWPRNSRS